MANVNVLTQLAAFRDIIKPGESLAVHTVLKIGGPAEALVSPRSVAELAAVVKTCAAGQIPLRVLGSGGNILVQDEGVKGVVLHLNAPAFTGIAIQGNHARAGCGASMAALISASARHNLAGLEALVGTSGSVGGGLRHITGDGSAEFGQYLRLVEVIDAAGTPQVRERDDLRQTYRTASLDDPVLVLAEFELENDSADAIVKRIRKAWIQRKANQPFSFQAAGQIFRNPRGLSAAALIEQAGLVGTRLGGAAVSDRNASYVIADPGTTAADVLRLIDQVRGRVQERFHVELELAISVW
jgi:UDP-N-acetylmuramate dehydrogenase